MTTTVNKPEGPMVAPVRMPSGNDTYVELTMTRYRDRFVYTVEHGDRFGHRGSWGRDNYADAVTTAASAWNWNMGVKS